MKIYLDKIPAEGIELNAHYTAGELDLETEEIRIPQPIDVRLKVDKEGNDLSVKGKITAGLETICARCLKTFVLPIEKEFRLDLIFKGENYFDISDNLREEIMLEYPIKALCSADCQGLCVSCGHNLNLGPCECSKQ
jgi:uncharacterized protein